MDDIRCFMPPIKRGWRWSNGELLYCKQWEMDDANLTTTEVTRRVLMASMQVVEEFLEFTTEVGDEYDSGWLPTLDVELKVDHKNIVQFRFFEKKTTSKTTAMNENNKIQVVSNDLVRRLLNTSQVMGAKEFRKVVDGYGQKLLNSGYDLDHTRRILIAGIKGYEGKVSRCGLEGRKLRRTAKESLGTRYKKQLIGKTTWYKGNRRKQDYYKQDSQRQGASTKGDYDKLKCPTEPTTVLFVECSKDGELARQLKELGS